MESAIVIPVYKEKLEVDEVLSLRQCLKVLGHHPVIFAVPETLNLVNYENICTEFLTDMYIERFDDRYFNNVQGYNELMLSTSFYKRFRLFECILIYQLDAYVFSDKLEYWCKKGFDYIGAPWFNDYLQSNVDDVFVKYSGNGGFSLRRVKKIIEVLETKVKYVKKINDIINEDQISGIKSPFAKILFRRFRIKNLAYFFIRNFYLNEDRFFAVFAQEILSEFRVATNKEAMLFAFECCPKRLYELTGGSLPFGCHAWRKHDEEFWSRFIEIPNDEWTAPST